MNKKIKTCVFFTVLIALNYAGAYLITHLPSTSWMYAPTLVAWSGVLLIALFGFIDEII